MPGPWLRGSLGPEVEMWRRRDSDGDAPPPYEFTWAWVLRNEPDGTSRLLVREEMRLHPAVGPVPRGARRGGQFRDEREDVARDQGPGRTGGLSRPWRRTGQHGRQVPRRARRDRHCPEEPPAARRSEVAGDPGYVAAVRLWGGRRTIVDRS